jgi:hypothetical protein
MQQSISNREYEILGKSENISNKATLKKIIERI